MDLNGLVGWAASMVDGWGRVEVAGTVVESGWSGKENFYFRLIGDGASIQCVVFRSRTPSMPPIVRNGDSVVVNGRLEVFKPRARLQLIVSDVAVVGGEK